jgi:prevent-host-death family protein
MQAIGVRELKARLSKYLRLVREGETVLITDRGEVIAEIRSRKPPPDVPPELHGLWLLAQQGLVRLGKSNIGKKYPPTGVCMPDGTSRRLLDAGREDRF